MRAKRVRATVKEVRPRAEVGVGAVGPGTGGGGRRQKGGSKKQVNEAEKQRRALQSASDDHSHREPAQILHASCSQSSLLV